MKELGGAIATGGIPMNGLLRQFTGDEIKELRQKHSSLSS